MRYPWVPVNSTNKVFYYQIRYLMKKMLDILQQFTFVIKKKEQNTDLTISNNTNRIDRLKQ